MIVDLARDQIFDFKSYILSWPDSLTLEEGTEMKRFIMFLSVLTLAVGVADTALALSLVAIGSEFTVYDENTGKYWYRDLSYFAGQSYDQQIASIAGLNTSNYAGLNDWHMANSLEMTALWSYDSYTIMTYFAPSASQLLAIGYDGRIWKGRYDAIPERPLIPFDGVHMVAGIWWEFDILQALWTSPELHTTLASDSYDWGEWWIGAWVVTENPHPQPPLLGPDTIVPEPASLILVGIGLMVLAAIRRNLL